MSQKQQNNFIRIYGVVLAVGAAGLGYFWWTAQEKHTAAEAEIEGALSKRESLRKKAIFPKKENVTLKQEQVAAYAKEVDALHAEAMKLQRDFKPEKDEKEVTLAQKFSAETLPSLKLNLDTFVDARNAATPGSLTLPKDFYLGMEKYATTAPIATAAPALDYQLDGIAKLCDVLLKTDGGISSLDYFHRTVLPFEISDSKPDAPEEKPEAKKPAPAKPVQGEKGKTKQPPPPAGPLMDESKLVKRYPIQLAFTSSGRAFYGIMNALVNIREGGPIFTINNIRVENTSKDGPDQTSGYEAEDVEDAQIGYPIPEGGIKPRFDARYILGNEKVKVYMELDLIHLNGPDEVKQSISELVDNKGGAVKKK